jgi:hypothetical protein
MELRAYVRTDSSDQRYTLKEGILVLFNVQQVLRILVVETYGRRMKAEGTAGSAYPNDASSYLHESFVHSRRKYATKADEQALDVAVVGRRQLRIPYREHSC